MVIFRLFCSENCKFSMNFHDNLKNKNRKNLKISFSFVSAHCASVMKVGSKLRRRGGGVCLSLVGTETDCCIFAHICLLSHRLYGPIVALDDPIPTSSIGCSIVWAHIPFIKEFPY